MLPTIDPTDDSVAWVCLSQLVLSFNAFYEEQKDSYMMLEKPKAISVEAQQRMKLMDKQRFQRVTMGVRAIHGAHSRACTADVTLCRFRCHI